MRHATVTTVAPTGTLSLLLGCSSGIEPYYALAFTRRVLEGEELVEFNPRFLPAWPPWAWTTRPAAGPWPPGASPERWRACRRRRPPPFATAHEIAPEAHLAMQAAFQAATDNGVSKTVNLAAEAGPEQVRRVFTQAHALGLKGGHRVPLRLPGPSGAGAVAPCRPGRPPGGAHAGTLPPAAAGS